MSEIVNDHEFWIGLKGKDEKAFKKLFYLYYPKLAAFAYSFLHNEMDSDMVATDVLLRLWENAGEIDITHTLNAYLFQAARNRCTDFYRSEAGRPQGVSLNDELRHLFITSDEIMDSLLLSELEDQINLSIQKLSVESRKIFLMSRRDNLSYEEISNLMGISVNTVKYHMKKALLHLRLDLSNYLMIALLMMIISAE